MVPGSKVCLAAVVLLAGCSIASAQGTTVGAGKVELGGFPGGGTFFVGGDDNKEVNFNVYTAGGGLTYYVSQKAAVEGEVTGSVGWAQDVVFNNAKVIHTQMPTVWSYSGNVLFFPGGTAGKRVPVYLTGGIGALSLRLACPPSRSATTWTPLERRRSSRKTSAAASRSSARPTRRTGGSAPTIAI